MIHIIKLLLVVAACLDWNYNSIVDAKSFPKLDYRLLNNWSLVPRGGSTAAKKVIADKDPQHAQVDATFSNESNRNENKDEYHNTMVTKRDGNMERLDKNKVRYYPCLVCN